MMQRFEKTVFVPLDEEERELIESIERDQWVPVKDFKTEQQKAVQAARNTLKKDKRINLLSQKGTTIKSRSRPLRKACPTKL
jgi:predicted DNA binding CopG/RHH family protein